MLRNALRPATRFIRSALGTNGMAAQVAMLDAKVDAVFHKLAANGADGPAPSDVTMEQVQSVPSAAPHIDINLILHHSRSALMRDMPAGARRILSAGCAGLWYFEWIEQTYGHVQEHLGIEYYASKPDGLPANVTWIANTAGNMEDVADQSCDLLISGQNIEHLWPCEVADFLAEAARVLCPGGTLSVDSPNRAMTEPLRWSQPEHTIELTVPEMRQLLELAGFEITKEAGIWLCQDPKTGAMLPYDPNFAGCNWTVTERLFSARDKPEQSFLWWIESRRLARTPDRQAISALLTEIFDKAWPERTQRLVVAPGRWTEYRNGEEWVLVSPGEPGIVFFGPYMPLRAGRHRVTFEFIPHNETTGAFARFDVAVGADATVVQQKDVLPGSNQVALEVDVPTLTFGCQFRCISLGRGGFAVRLQVGLTESLW